MSAHTPGPWDFTVEASGHASVYRAGQNIPRGHKHIAQVCQGEFSPDEVQANARLLALAPDLLAIVRVIADGQWTVAGIKERACRVLAQAVNEGAKT